MFTGNKAARILNVCKYAARTKKYIVFARYALVKRDVILDFNPIADSHAGGNEYILSDVAVPSDDCAFHYVREMPDDGIFAYACAVVYDGSVMCFVFHSSGLFIEEKYCWFFV
jgi:hypothetical protein